MFQGDILSSNGSLDFVDNIINTYIDLDRLINDAGLSDSQMRVIKKMMMGWTSADIAEAFNVQPQTIDVHLRRAVEKIVEANNKRWLLYAATIKEYRNEKG